MTETVVMIANPIAGSARMNKVQSAMDMIARQGLRADLKLTTHRGHAEEIAREASGRNCKMVIACGGDGTINEVINGLAGTQTPLAIVPMGTANVLAHEIGIPADAESAIKTALTQQARHIALGRVEAQGLLRYFSLMCGAGYDAQTVVGVRGALKTLLGKAAYVINGAMVLAKWRPAAIHIKVDGIERICHSLIISKARQYAGDFILAPEADIREPLFTLTLIKGPLRRDIARLMMGLINGTGIRSQGIIQICCSKIEIITPTHMQIDGDYLCNSQATITAIPNALRLIY